jgi:hypothetical protein
MMHSTAHIGFILLFFRVVDQNRRLRGLPNVDLILPTAHAIP